MEMGKTAHAGVAEQTIPLLGHRKTKMPTDQTEAGGGEMSHFFSVIICTFNRANLLPRALDSLLAQSEPDWEAIIIDDGSNDQTAKVVARYTDICANIRYFQRTNNRGIGAARNIGVKLAAGKYLTFLDSDDEYAVDHLASRKRLLMMASGIQLLHGGLRIVGDPHVVDKDHPDKLIHLSECKVGGTFFVRRDVFKEIGGFEDLAYAEDSSFYERAFAAGVCCSYTPYPSYIYYRNVAGQVTEERAVLNGHVDQNSKSWCC